MQSAEKRNTTKQTTNPKRYNESPLLDSAEEADFLLQIDNAGKKPIRLPGVKSVGNSIFNKPTVNTTSFSASATTLSPISVAVAASAAKNDEFRSAAAPGGAQQNQQIRHKQQLEEQRTKREEEVQQHESLSAIIPFPEPSPLTQRIRARLASACGSSSIASTLVRQVSPSTLKAVRNPALLVAYFDACPYSRATEDGLVSLANRMYVRNLDSRSSPPFSIAMYDKRAEGNRTFAEEQLKASPVPKLYLLDPYRRAIIEWRGEPMSDTWPVVNSRGIETGEKTRRLPESAIMDALERVFMPNMQ